MTEINTSTANNQVNDAKLQLSPLEQLKLNLELAEKNLNSSSNDVKKQIEYWNEIKSCKFLIKEYETEIAALNEIEDIDDQ